MAHTPNALIIQDCVAINLEFTLHKSNIAWAKPLLQRIVSEVPHATRNKVSVAVKAQGAYLKPKHSFSSVKCETGFWGVQNYTVPLNVDASQSTQDHSLLYLPLHQPSFNGLPKPLELPISQRTT